MSSLSAMDKFTQAMQHIYQFPTHQDSSKQWTPPPASSGHHGRYLWTDAFGVLNFITMSKELTSSHYLDLAKALVHTVHETLGRTRDLKSRLPGATDLSPLSGGLRIGKEDETGEDCDGQYYHYSTMWMYALNRLSIATGEAYYNNHAIVLAKATHSAFVYLRGSSRPRIAWKMSIDLDDALSPSGHGRITKLKDEIVEYKKILDTKWEGYSSEDPLDLGMTLWIAHFFDGEADWATALMKSAESGMKELYGGSSSSLKHSIKDRLAFREFGSALGIRCSKNDEIDTYAEQIIKIWEDEGRVPVPQQGNMKSMEPIDCVMYAASLVPGAFMRGYLQ